jgi:hypothetical protein
MTDASRRRRRKITVSISDDLHRKLVLAKLIARKPIYALVEEGINLVIAHYRAQHDAERRQTES